MVYDIVIANPPFTGSVDKGDINESFELNTGKSELLFLERIYKMLRIGGTAGVVVPQGVLFSSGKVFKQARQILLDRCELKAVISMPSGFFKPYTGVATAVLIFTKGGETENVWFYDMQSDGWSLDDKRKELFNSEGNRDFGDLHKVIERYGDVNKNVERDKRHFTVPKEEIFQNGISLSFNTYFEESYVPPSYDSPAKILKDLGAVEEKIADAIDEIKSILK